MNPVDGGPYDNPARMTHLLGVPFSEWLDVKLLADELNISVRGLVQQYRLFLHGGHRAVAQERMRLAIDKKLIDATMLPGPIELDNARRDPGYVYTRMIRETEALRARWSLLEERVASAERRLAKLRNV